MKRLYSPWRSQYIAQTDLDDLFARTVRLAKKMSAFMSYLKNTSLKGSKYH